jgi:hypothetical protein
MTQERAFIKPKTLADRVADANRLIDLLGGNNKLADLLGVSKGRVSQMRTEGLPDKHLEVVRRLRPDLFQEETKSSEPSGKRESAQMNIYLDAGYRFAADYETIVSIDGNQIVLKQTRDGVLHTISFSPDRAIGVAEALEIVVDEYSEAYSSLVDEKIYGGE